MTKWKILNVIAFLLSWIAITVSYYSFLYPAPFAIVPLLRQVEWKYFLLVYTVLLLFAFTFSFMLSRQGAFQRTFFKTLLALQIAAMMTMSILTFLTLNKKRSGLKELFSELEKQAAHDIEADSIHYISYGFPIPDSNYMKRDSIMAKYGIRYTANCIIDQLTKESDAYYKQLTNTYLNKRNGKNWKKKMQKELEQYPAY